MARITLSASSIAPFPVQRKQGCMKEGKVLGGGGGGKGEIPRVGVGGKCKHPSVYKKHQTLYYNHIIFPGYPLK